MENNPAENKVVEVVPEPISKYYHEAMMAAMERANKRLAIIVMIALVMFFATNIAWLWAWMQYDYESETVETTTTYEYQQDGEGVNIIGNQNEVN